MSNLAEVTFLKEAEEMNNLLTTLDLHNKGGIEVVEEYMLQQEQVDCPLYHNFGPGLYMREVHIPADTIVIGHHHYHEHTNFLLKGKISVLKDNDVITYEAPMMLVAPAGRKLAYAHTDVIWMNVYAEESTDIDAIEEKLFDQSPVYKAHIEKLIALKKEK